MVGHHDSRIAFEHMKDKYAQIPEEEVRIPRLDLSGALGVVLGARERIEGYRDALLELSGFAPEAFDDLYFAALALRHAQVQEQLASTPATDLAPLIEEAKPLRERLFRVASLMAFEGWLDGDALGNLAGPRGHDDLALDLLQLSAMLQQAWEDIEHQVPVTLEQLHRASTLGDEITLALARKDMVAQAEAVELRNRAFTLLHHHYEEVRRGIQYLRYWHGDADELCPSIFTSRRRGKKKVAPAPAPAPAPIPDPM